MSRAKITALVLVNWKGVFYERYLLDRHVTALEGANGAGKTTVMIAAYVALLPDMSKLRFTNLGETAATGGDRGIWGRLGELGRPSYTVLEIEVGERRLLAGVRLVRTTEPTVEPTAFIVDGLGPDVKLSDLLLVRQLDGDHVPTLDDIGIAAAAAGGELHAFKTTKGYFAELFERGITPMRLTGDEERSKLNEMLRTSMTGGISRALTSELRSFLLKEETGLGDTLTRMRANLEACARTRSEVGDARRLEREITGIYEAGAEMFAAAIHATREAAAQAERDVEAARPVVDDAVRAERDHILSIAQLETRGRLVETQLAAVRRELATALALRDRASAARVVKARLAELERELATLVAVERRAEVERVAAATARSAARADRTRALEALDRAAHGLADLQAGLDELIRRAHSYRQLARRLDDARRLIPSPALTADDAEQHLATLDQERAGLETERARGDRASRDVAIRRTEYAAALAALAAISSDPSAAAASELDGDPHAAARAQLARLAERERQIDRGDELDRELAEALRLAGRQQLVRTAAVDLALVAAVAGSDAVAAPATVAGSDAVAGPDAVARALEATEQELRELDDRADTRRATEVIARSRETELRGRLATLDERIARRQLAATLAGRLGAPGITRTELLVLRDQLAAEAHGLADQRTQLEARRTELQQRATAVERSGTNLDPALLRLRDELGAELLASRFEELDLQAASWVEAKLGPLADALIVDDLDAATVAVAASERTADSVYLVRAGTAFEVELPDQRGAEDVPTLPLGATAEVVEPTDVVTVEPFGVRITRRRPRPSLGRLARERQVAELHAQIARDAEALDTLATRATQAARRRADVEQLEPVVDTLAIDDPALEREALTSELASLATTLRSHDAERAIDQDRALVVRTRLDALRRLWPDVALLALPDHAARARELQAIISDRDAARAELRRVAAARVTLADHLDILRTPPPDDAALADSIARRRLIDARLDAIALARAALDDVLLHRHAASYDDAEAALDARARLAPALEAQHAAARDAVQLAADAEATAEEIWETATKAAQVAEAARAAASAHRDRAFTELAALGPPADEATLRDADTLAPQADQLDTESRELVTQRALAVERLERARRTALEARARLAALTSDVAPTLEAWTTLRDRASAESLLHTVLANPSHSGRTSLQLIADAWSKREVLLDRVARARGGDELLVAIRDNAQDGLGHLATWQSTRSWLRCRVPAQVADVEEPLLALERLRDHLDVLEGRLGRQELDLRGMSEDVARGIDVQVRRAHGQVRRLASQLEGISFGSIQGIRVEIRRVERMEQILRALRLGEAQELLFISSVPIEEALDEIFRRYGGGGRGGGQRLLDYREYVELAVEIRRRSTGTWEPASPTKLSTGEAIGVGAALMMVVLTEWERDANLLRATTTGGSLRFLFLDEANRLSRDNLGVLFDLCKNLDLQLLIAAPEVARAEGNTTYRLVRHVTDDDREEVIVSGRRALPHVASIEGELAGDATVDGDASAVDDPETAVESTPTAAGRVGIASGVADPGTAFEPAPSAATVDGLVGIAAVAAEPAFEPELQ